jgi:hypothetical protein
LQDKKNRNKDANLVESLYIKCFETNRQNFARQDLQISWTAFFRGGIVFKKGFEPAEGVLFPRPLEISWTHVIEYMI